MSFRILITLCLLLFVQIPCLAQGTSIPFRPVPNAPYFQSPQLTVDSVDNDTIVLCVKSPKSGPARLFWAIHYDPQFNPQKSIRFMLKPGTDYVFIASQPGYLNGKERESTRGMDQSKEFEVTIYLASITQVIELPNIFYDFAKWDLRPESMVSLDNLVETLEDNPNVTIELMSHTDSRGTPADNQELSQKRAQSVVDYLISKGIQIYFNFSIIV